MSSYQAIWNRFKVALKDFETPVEITDGYIFDYPRVTNKVELYRSSKFLTGDVDSEGHKKYFFNICNPQAGNVTKFIDLDTKDVLFRSRSGKDRLKSTLATDMFRQYAKKKKFGILLNEMSEQLPIWGHVILRKYKDKIKRIHMKDVMWDMSVDSIHQSPYLIFRHHMQPWEIEKMIEKGWDEAEVKKITDSARENNVSDVVVYEYMAEFSRADLELKGKGFSKGVCLLASLDETNDSQSGQKRAQDAAVFYRAAIDEYPVKELKMFDIDGRALGLGIFEMLFEDIQS